VRPTFLRFDLPFIGAQNIPAYSTMLLLGFMIALWIARREEDALGRDGNRMVDLGIWMLVFGVLGARLMSVVADGHFQDFVNLCVDPTKVVPADAWAREITCTTDAQCGGHYLCNTANQSCYPPQDCFEAFKFWKSGLAFYGGLLLAAPIGLWYAHKKQMGLWRIGDQTSPWIMFGLAVGRIGCFFNGCCYGKETEGWWAVHFPKQEHPVHPTQIYESLAALAICAICYFVIRPRKRSHGVVFAAMIAMYGAARFVLEIWRDDERGGFAGLSSSQLVAIPMILTGLWLLATRRRRPQSIEA
jgi:phosphatidylglycerol---prolipoprotein diacylglyceryl transferase